MCGGWGERFSLYDMDASFGVLAPQYWPMAVIATVSLALVSWLFGHRMY
jgi:hypothetical protein